MGKLHLKETPEERQRRKDKARRSRKHTHRKTSPDDTEKPEKKRRRRSNVGPDVNEDGRTSFQGGSSQAYLAELDAEIEDRRFHEKLYDAMMDDYDNRLDSIEANLNEYAHIPRRWQSVRETGSYEYSKANDPNVMDDEEYAEWVREGMWRRTHKAEMEERDRREAEAKARKEREKKAREETRRLEREAEAKRAAKRELKEVRRHREAWDYYNARWQTYTDTTADQLLGFNDIAWPVFPVVTTTATITEEGISEFVFHRLDKENTKGRKERIREALLRWHPDKFESKLGSRLQEKEREHILEGVGIVARCLNNMMASV